MKPHVAAQLRAQILASGQGVDTGIELNYTENDFVSPLSDRDALLLNTISQKGGLGHFGGDFDDRTTALLNSLSEKASAKEGIFGGFISRKKNLNSRTSLTSVFSGLMSRSSLSKALSLAMSERELTNTSAEKRMGIRKVDIARVKNGAATLDKGVEILDALGYEVHMEVRPKAVD